MSMGLHTDYLWFFITIKYQNNSNITLVEASANSLLTNDIVDIDLNYRQSFFVI